MTEIYLVKTPICKQFYRVTLALHLIFALVLVVEPNTSGKMVGQNLGEKKFTIKMSVLF